MKTTLNEIRKYSPCKSSWIKLLDALDKTSADDEPLEFRTIYRSLGADDLIWCSRVLDKKSRVYLGAKFAETSLQYTEDKRVHDSVAVCFKFASGEATEEELAAAGAAAWAAAGAAGAAARAAGAAAWAAAGAATRAAAWAAAWATAGAAAKLEEFAQIMLRYVKD